MKNFGTRSSILVGLCGTALMLANIACSSSSTPGGEGGSGGTSAAGGKGGGSGGTSAAGGGAGTAAAPVLSYTFDSTVQGWKLQTYVEAAGSAYHDLGGLAADAAVPTNYPVVTANATEGSPNPGCLQVTATFTDYQQYVEVLVPVANVDLTGKKIKAQVQATTAFYGGAFIYADSGTTYVYGGGGGSTIATGAWGALALDLATVTAPTGSPAPFDPTDIVQIGVHIYSDSAPTDGGAFTTASYTFLVDTVQAL